MGEPPIPPQEPLRRSRNGAMGDAGMRVSLVPAGPIPLWSGKEKEKVIPPIPLSHNPLRPSGSRRGHPPPPHYLPDPPFGIRWRYSMPPLVVVRTSP